VICRLDHAVWSARVVRLAPDTKPERVACAIRTDGHVTARPGERPEETRQAETGTDERTPIYLACPEPTSVHDHVGCVRPNLRLRTRTALATAARSRGLATPHDDEIRATRGALDEFEVADESLERYRAQVAETAEAVERAREDAAEARGRLRERRENGLATDAAERRLEEVLAALSEAETEAIAARERYERERARRRTRLDERDRRLRLEDRLGNLERRARKQLTERVREEFERALTAVPNARSEAEKPFDADPVDAALAIARLGRLRAPVVVAVDRFDSPTAAAQWLSADVVYI